MMKFSVWYNLKQNKLLLCFESFGVIYERTRGPATKVPKHAWTGTKLMEHGWEFIGWSK